MNTKEKMIQQILSDMNFDLTGEQLRKLRMILTARTDDLDINQGIRDLVLYDQTSDDAAYQAYFVSKKIEGLSDKSLEQYRHTIDRFRRDVRKDFKDVKANDIRLYLANRQYWRSDRRG